MSDRETHVSGHGGWTAVVMNPEAIEQDGPVRLRLDDGSQVIVRGQHFVSENGDWFLPLSLPVEKSLEDQPMISEDGATDVIPVLAERLVIEKRVETTGSVVVQKRVEAERHEVDPPLSAETVDIEHVPVGRVIDTPAAVRMVGDEIVVPVMEEVLVVEKRLVLKEEIHIRRRHTTFHQPQTVDVFREIAEVRRSSTDGRADG